MTMHSRLTRETRREIDRQNAKWPDYLIRLENWGDVPHIPKHLVDVWRSKHYLVQVYRGEHPLVEARISVSRTCIQDDGKWVDGIGWDNLQRIKRECGFGAFDAVEVFPSDSDIVNVANMRHLWVMKSALPFKWGYHEHQESAMFGDGD